MSILHIFLLLNLICVFYAFDVNKNVTNDGTNQLSTCQITQYVLALQDDCGFESIHGLWPDPESSCSYCTTEVFSEC